MIGIEMVKRLEKIHKFNYLYRDIKPENICIGEGDNYNVITVIDFGLAKQYRDHNG